MINVGIIGLGRIGKIHLCNIAQSVRNMQVVIVAEPFLSEETIAFAKSYGVNRISKDYREILKDRSVDAVIICSSTDTHAEISIEAIKAGKNVFCEKPIDQSIEKILKVRLALEDNPVKYQVGFNRRFDHNFLAIRNTVSGGAFGKIHIIKITSRDPQPPNPRYIAVSGGMFMDMTIHDFDMVRYLSGAEITEVYVNSAVLIDQEIGRQGDVDTAVITMKMSDGSLALIDNSRKAVYGYDQRAEVFGEGGMVFCGNDTLSAVITASEKGITGEKPLYFFLERYKDSFVNEMQAFADSIENNTDTKVGIEDGLQAVIIAKAAKLSEKEHRPVLLSEVSV